MLDKIQFLEDSLEELIDMANRKTIEFNQLFPNEEEYFQVSIAYAKSKEMNTLKIERIKEITNQIFECRDLAEKSRKREIIKARNAFIYVVKHNFDLSLNKIADFVGNKNHATIIHSLNEFEGQYQTNDSYFHIVKAY